MLRLWPETIYIGLFPGCCWLQRGTNTPAKICSIPYTIEPAALLQNLDSMLNEQLPPIAKGSRLKITVSDSIASTVVLPWQSELNRTEEIDGYARVCFERSGTKISEDWVLHAEFRCFGSMGLAYALPREWLEELLSFLKKRKLNLISVLPLTATGYFKQDFKFKGNPTLLLLQEMSRHSAMVFNNDGLIGYDVEPFSRSLDETRNRLLRRVAANFADISRVLCWSVDGQYVEISAESLAKCFSHAKAMYLKHQAWN